MTAIPLVASCAAAQIQDHLLLVARLHPREKGLDLGILFGREVNSIDFEDALGFQLPAVKTTGAGIGRIADPRALLCRDALCDGSSGEAHLDVVLFRKSERKIDRKFPILLLEGVFLRGC